MTPTDRLIAAYGALWLLWWLVTYLLERRAHHEHRERPRWGPE